MNGSIRFKNGSITGFLGKNGYLNCSGIDVFESPPIVIITPITSRNSLARCHIEIPKADIPAFCKLLDRKELLSLVLDNLKPEVLPSLMGLNDELDEEIAERLEK